MKPKFIIFTIMFFCISTSTIFSQVFKMTDFYPKVENGTMISASEKVLSSNLTSILNQVWIPDNWVDEGRILYSYNAAGLLAEVSYDSLDSGNWKTFGSMQMEYNANNQLYKDINLFYESDGSIVHGVKWEYKYSDNKMSEGFQYMWDVDSDLWESYQKQVYTYSGELITKIEDYTDMGDGSWELSGETNLKYDNQDREIESYSKNWNSIDNKFENSDLTTTEYFKDHKISKWESRSWDMINEKWSEENYTITEYQYDNNDNCIEEETIFSVGLMGFSFLSKSKLKNAYDANNFLIETIDYTWDDGSQQYLPLTKDEITNNSEGLPEIMIEYIRAGGEWVKAEKFIYNYGGTVDVVMDTIVPNKLSIAQNYPNPFNPSTTIEYTIPKKSSVKIIMYDILGNYITTLVNETKLAGEYSVVFDAAEMASGSYIYTIQDGHSIISRKCLLIK